MTLFRVPLVSRVILVSLVALTALTALTAMGQPPWPPAPDPANAPETVEAATDWTERLFQNARERTAASREAFEEGRYQDAVEPARTARRLSPDDPLTNLNLGSALLGAGQPQDALEPLTRAAEALEARYAERPDDRRARVAAGAHYNRGNALFAAGDLEGAVRAYEQALRRAPTHEDAKFNLELALRQQQNEQQQQGEDGQQEDGSQDPQGEDDSEGQDQDQEPQGEGEQEQGEGGEDEQEQEPQSPEDEGGEQQPGEPQPQGQGDGEPEDSRLPRFEDQPDMTAEEAAAILEAVENLEREQRQEEAERRARERVPKEKDW